MNPTDNRRRQYPPAAWMILVAIVASLPLPASKAAVSGEEATYNTPQQAVQALLAAVRANGPGQLLTVLGPKGRPLVYSGDPVADRNGREKFVDAYDKAHRIERQGPTRAVIVIGEKQWPFPIPIVRKGSVWRFDTAAGAQEILDRRIGRNELSAIETCRAYVDAQREYAARIPHSDGMLEYAEHFMSRPGSRDGLYWPSPVGEPESPMGPLVAAAREEGYTPGEGTHPRRFPYHGYFYRILKGQGPHAADGARDYLVDGHMIGGFALVAFPATYGDSGIMTFIVNQDGIVYQKNLGPDTEAIARQMTEFDPDKSWSKAPTNEAP